MTEKEKTMNELLEIEKERARRVGVEAWCAVKRVEVDIINSLKRLKEELFIETSKRKMDVRDIWEIIDKIFGDKLT
jgi:hypothetical protein